MSGGFDKALAEKASGPPAVVLRYGATLDALRPGSGPDERRLRCGILFLRDEATAGAIRAGWDASIVLSAIESIASVRAYASMPLAELRVVRDALTRMMMAARALEMRGPGRGGLN